MRKLSNRKGYTLVEVILVTGIMGLIGAGAMAMMTASARCFDNTTTEAYTDTDAVIAMQKIVHDVREAKDARPIANGERLRVIFPTRAEGKEYYNRQEADMANQVDYYLSDATGVPGHSGTWLWRGKNNNNRQPLRRDVTGVSFQNDLPHSITITITVRNNAADGPKETKLTQRVLYLRNY